MLESGGSKPDDFVEYHSLPLMRQLFCRSIVFTLFLILLFTSQILYYTWFIGKYNNLIHALIPLLVVLCLYNGYMYLMQPFHLSLCLLMTLYIVQLAIYSECGGVRFLSNSVYSYLSTLIITYFTLLLYCIINISN